MPTTTLPRLLGSALKNYFTDDIPRWGASLSYYTLFAVAPMLVVAIAVASTVFSEEIVRGEIVNQIDQLIGAQGALAIEDLLDNARRDSSGGWAALLGTGAFVLASTGAFLELQAALNRVWRVTPKPGLNLKKLVINRAQSLALIVGMGFLLLVSLVVSAALAALSSWLESRTGESAVLLNVINLVVSLLVITGVFAALFKVLPDVKQKWSDVLPGALVTAILFSAGKQLIGLYLGRSAVASAYGAAGSIVVLMLWVYYSSQMILLGAEFTRLFAERDRRERVPAKSFARKTSKEKAPVI